jgi:hypothetical protein
MAKPHLKPVKWDMHKAQIISGILSNCEGIPPPGIIDKAVKRAKYPEVLGILLKLRDDLSSWEGHRSKYSWSPQEIIRECLNKGPSFYDLYKSAKREAMYRGVGAIDPQTGAYLYGKPDRDWWDGPNSWFDMRFTLFWDLGSDDHEHMFSEGSDDTLVDPDQVEAFGYSLLSILPDTFSITEDILASYKVGSAKSFDPSCPNDKRMPEWLLNHGAFREDDGPPIAKVKGVLIPKCPGETRDGVTIPTTTKRILTRVGSAISQLMQAGKFRKRHPTGMNYEEVDSKLQHFSDKYSWFLCLDFEKIGLTLPTYIISKVLDTCYDITEYEPFLEAKNLFEGLEYHNGSDYYKIMRGFCLGLFNEGMTLVQLALHHMSCIETDVDHDGMFLNDDAVVAFYTKKEALAYAEADSTSCLALGIPRKDAKSFLAKGFFVFCEEYYKDSKLNKDVLRNCAYNACYYMPTIRLAKELFSSITMSLGLDEDALPPLVEFWGYEFYEDEYLHPFEFGGWYHIMEYGYNTACSNYIPSLDGYWAMRAIDLPLRHKGRVGKHPTQPLSRVINASKCEPVDNLKWEPLTRLEDLFGDARAISFYRGQTDTGKDNSDWFSTLRQRKAIEYFAKNRRTIPDDSAITYLVNKGYMPPLNSIKLNL